MTPWDYMTPRQGTPLVWGTSDCCLLAGDWVLSQTGLDLMADLRGTYHGPLGAARVWRRLGGLQTAITQRLDKHFPRVHVTRAPVGALVLIQSHNRHVSCGVLDRFGVWAYSDMGLQMVQPPRQATFWNIYHAANHNPPMA